jgi:hypothetical protein
MKTSSATNHVTARTLGGGNAPRACLNCFPSRSDISVLLCFQETGTSKLKSKTGRIASSYAIVRPASGCRASRVLCSIIFRVPDSQGFTSILVTDGSVSAAVQWLTHFVQCKANSHSKRAFQHISFPLDRPCPPAKSWTLAQTWTSGYLNPCLRASGFCWPCSWSISNCPPPFSSSRRAGTGLFVLAPKKQQGAALEVLWAALGGQAACGQGVRYVLVPLGPGTRAGSKSQALGLGGWYLA